MTIDISNNNPRISYSVASGVTQTTFAVPFEFFDDSDLNVYVDSVLKTITSDYTLTGGDGSTGTITMSVTGAVSGSTVQLTRDTTIERVTDFTAGVDINRAALNTQLDTLTAISADVKDLAERAIRVEDLEVAPNLVLPSIADRVGKLLVFDTEGGVSVASEEALGNIILGANYITDSFTGDGSTTAFTLSVAASSKNNTQVHVDGVYQNKATYSLNTSTLTFSEAPPLNASIEVVSGDSISEGSIANSSAIDYNQGGTGAVDRTVKAKLQEFVSVKDFGAVGDGVTDDTAAIQAAIDAVSLNGTLLMPAGTYLVSGVLDFRRVSVLGNTANIEGSHSGIVAILGGASVTTINPQQSLNRVYRTGGQTTTPTVRIIGAKSMTIFLSFSEYVQLYSDSDVSADANIGYNNFYFTFLFKLELTNNPSTSGGAQWINENKFFLNRIKDLVLDGDYNFNHNYFIGGNFEGTATIDIQVGRSNYVTEVRAEGDLTVNFGSGTNDCIVELGYTLSGHRYPSTSTLTVNNSGEMCAVVHAMDKYASYLPIVGFDYQTLQNDGSIYNVIGASNITIGTSNLTIAPTTIFYTSRLIPIDEAANFFHGYLQLITAGGGVVRVKGYNSSKTLITPSDGDWYADGVGDRQFSQTAAIFPLGARFWITNPDCAYVVIEAQSAGAGLTCDGFSLAQRAFRDLSNINFMASLTAEGTDNNIV